MFTTFEFVLLVLVLVLIKYHWSRRKLYMLAARLPGPPALPIIGNIYSIMSFSGQKNINAINNVAQKYYKTELPVRLWCGPFLCVLLTTPEDIQVILNSPGSLEKITEIYSFVKELFDGSLLFLQMTRWRSIRKSLSVAFTKLFCEKALDMFNKRTDLHVQDLNGKTVWTEDKINEFCVITGLDNLLCTLTNTEITDIDFDQHATVMKRGMNISFYRFKWMWYLSDTLFKFSTKYNDHKNILMYYRKMNSAIMEKRKLFLENEQNETENNKCALDVLLDLEKNGQISKNELNNNFQLFLTSSETTGSLVYHSLMMLAIHKDVQKRVHEELDSIFGSTERPITAEDLREMVYVDMVLKETLRLFTKVIFIGRRLTTDVKLTNCTLPKGTDCIIPIYSIHKNPNLWQQADEFYPEHFMPINSDKRHKYSYLPFSGGPRNCNGERLAMTMAKVMFAKILYKYDLNTGAKMSDLRATFNFIIHWKFENSITITPRNKQTN